MNLKDITSRVCEIAKRTGEYLIIERKGFKKENVLQKNSHDYVSYVDKEAEKRIVKELKVILPEAGFITEEGTVEQSNSGLNWIIDPLDGTTNFIQNHAPYCVSIALAQDENILLGVVYEVCRDECFYAWKDGGSFLNGKQIEVSDNNMDQAFIGLDLPYNAEEYKPIILNVFDKLYGKVSSLRIAGAAAISLCYVAAGRYDGWAEAFIKTWDFSAGAIIVKEAGGEVSTFDGDKNISKTHHIIATNKIIHEPFREILNIKKLN